MMIGYHQEAHLPGSKHGTPPQGFLSGNYGQESLQKLTGLIAELKRIVHAAKAPYAITYQGGRKSKNDQAGFESVQAPSIHTRTTRGSDCTILE